MLQSRKPYREKLELLQVRRQKREETKVVALRRPSVRSLCQAWPGTRLLKLRLLASGQRGETLSILRLKLFSFTKNWLIRFYRGRSLPITDLHSGSLRGFGSLVKEPEQRVTERREESQRQRERERERERERRATGITYLQLSRTKGHAHPNDRD